MLSMAAIPSGFSDIYGHLAAIAVVSVKVTVSPWARHGWYPPALGFNMSGKVTAPSRNSEFRTPEELTLEPKKYFM